MSRRALAYAEQSLGVHVVYEDAETAHAELDKVISDLDKAHDRKRGVASAIEDRNLELLHSEWSKHPDMAASRMDQHMKLVRFKDETLRDLQRKLEEASSTIQGLDYDADMLRLRIKIKVARMEELGGYLHYLGAVKEAETAAKNPLPQRDTTP